MMDGATGGHEDRRMEYKDSIGCIQDKLQTINIDSLSEHVEFSPNTK